MEQFEKDYNNRQQTATHEDRDLYPENKSDSISIETPEISLPKGGGALKGIDEKFKVNAANGTANINIALPFSPGRNGFAPSLALSYNSGSGNGVFGLGWTLESSSIKRKTDKRLPHYNSLNLEKDVFTISGFEDLVPYMEKQSSGNWEAKIINDVGVTIRRYRPRIEGSFSRIEQIEDASLGMFWKVTSRNNVVTIYGRSENARIANPSNKKQIFEWLPEFSYDNKGNWIKYIYKKENLDNVPDVLHEKNRKEGLALFTNTYLKKVQYGNKTAYYPNASNPYNPQEPENGDSFFEVVLDYGEHDLDIPTPTETALWTYRNDPFSTFRSGFEIRTNRLCRRVLMFHHFEDEKQFVGTSEEENFGINYLVRSLDVIYTASSINNSGIAEVSYLQSITQSGYIRKPDGSYSKKSLPSIEYDYQKLNWNSEIKTIQKDQSIHAPIGLSNNYTWIDLFSEGISGILTEQGNAWYYKSNLGNLNEDGHLEFSEAKAIKSIPSYRGIGNTLTIRDLASNGEKQLVVQNEHVNGYFELKFEEGQNAFTPFKNNPNIDLSAPNLRFIDLTGDGVPDIVISEHTAFTWYASEEKTGFSVAQSTAKLMDEEKGPSIVFSNQDESIFLADLTGDGLTDIVRIRNGEISYWANQGYGKFSAKINMSNAPVFDHEDQYNPQQIQLADISGTGASDIIYLGKNSIQAYLNLSGNSWSEIHEIETNFPINQNTNIHVLDLLGTGTSCLVWSSDLPEHAGFPMRYMDLMDSKKPHVLSSYKNNMGKECHLEYKSSTYYYLKDKQNGTPWISKLPFPVQLISKSTMIEKISDVKFSSNYSYHHGYFDHAEKEFRGFGRVDQTDSEFYPEWKRNNLSNKLEKDVSLFQKPVLSKTWFHTGAYLDQEKILKQYESEYWYNAFNRAFPSAPLSVIEPTLPDADLLIDELDKSGTVLREAFRACKGMTLRQEIFALDAPDNPTDADLQKQMKPYTVAMHNCNIQSLQAKADQEHAVFLVTESEAINIHYERDETDYRMSHKLNCEIDELGNVLESVSVVYGRDPNKADLDFQSLEDEVTDFREDVLDNSALQKTQLQNAFLSNITKAKNAQIKTHLIFNQSEFAKYKAGGVDYNDIDLPNTYRLRLPYQSVTYELTGTTKSGLIYTIDEIKNALSLATERDYQSSISTGIQKRVIEHKKIKYLSKNLSALAFGFFDELGMTFETYQKAFTPNLISDIYKKKDNTAIDVNGSTIESVLLAEGKFTLIDGGYWIRSGIVHYRDTLTEAQSAVKNRFYVPVFYEDPFGSITKVKYDVESHTGSVRNNDGYYLYVRETEDVLGNKVEVDIFNYRVLKPNRVFDVNANPSSSIHNELGLVKAMAMEGNGYYEANNHVIEIADSLSGLKEYETNAEKTHFKDLLESADSSSTNTSQLKTKAKLLLKNSTARFCYDFDKYQEIDKENQNFISTNQSDKIKDVVPTFNVSIVRHEHNNVNPNSDVQVAFQYSNGLSNQIMTKVQAEPGMAHYMDNGTLKEKDTGTELRWIANGRTILNNKSNPVKQYEPYFSTNFLFENDKDLVERGVSPIIYYDSLGRQNKTIFPDGTLSKVQFDSWKQLTYDRNDTVLDPDCLWYLQRSDNSRSDFIADLKEQQAAVKASLHAVTPTRVFQDSLGRPILSIEDNGTDSSSKKKYYSSFIELDLESNILSVIDARGNAVRNYKYNMLGRRLYHDCMDSGERWLLNNSYDNPIYTWDGKSQIFKSTYDQIHRLIEFRVNGVLIEKKIYGESISDSEKNNLRTQVAKYFDSSGRTEIENFDFKGNALAIKRQLIATPNSAITDWSSTPVDQHLSPESFFKVTEYDAANRMTRLYNWHRNENNLTVYIPTYNERGALKEEQHITAADKTDVFNTGRSILAVSRLEYNEKGQRTRIRYGNGTTTRYQYNPLNFRLIQLRTTKSGVGGNLPTAPSNLSDPNVLQNLYYTYDPIGNITECEDDAYEPIFFKNQLVEPKSKYSYDALYRLTEASGREQNNLNKAPQANEQDSVEFDFPILSNGTSDKTLRNYTQKYYYDPAGNILRMRHVSPNSTQRWTRKYSYDLDSNRLTKSWTGNASTAANTIHYTYDAHGNMLNYNLTAEEYKPNWDYHDRVHHINLGGGGNAHYNYRSDKQRVRKYIEKGGLKEERIYLGGMELYRRSDSAGNILEEIETHHLTIGAQRVLIVENVISTNNNQLNTGILDRYQYHNILSSVGLELNGSGDIISYEEYHPFGTVAFRAKNKAIKSISKRYRFTGMERDEESGLNYHSARYYMPWLGRWMSSDPSGLSDGLNIYRYINNNPIKFTDLSGLQADAPPSTVPYADPNAFAESDAAVEYFVSREEAIAYFNSVDVPTGGNVAPSETPTTPSGGGSGEEEPEARTQMSILWEEAEAADYSEESVLNLLAEIDRNFESGTRDWEMQRVAVWATAAVRHREQGNYLNATILYGGATVGGLGIGMGMFGDSKEETGLRMGAMAAISAFGGSIVNRIFGRGAGAGAGAAAGATDDAAALAAGATDDAAAVAAGAADDAAAVVAGTADDAAAAAAGAADDAAAGVANLSDDVIRGRLNFNAGSAQAANRLGFDPSDIVINNGTADIPIIFTETLARADLNTIYRVLQNAGVRAVRINSGPVINGRLAGLLDRLYEGGRSFMGFTIQRTGDPMNMFILTKSL